MSYCLWQAIYCSSDDRDVSFNVLLFKAIPESSVQLFHVVSCKFSQAKVPTLITTLTGGITLLVDGR